METFNQTWLPRLLLVVLGAMVALTVYDFTTGPPENTVCTITAADSNVATCTYTVASTEVAQLAVRTLSDAEFAKQVTEIHENSTESVVQIIGWLFFLGMLVLMARAKWKASQPRTFI